ncbi:MAG TPA: ASCH domain-containing protein [Kofleriaceae bacterium]
MRATLWMFDVAHRVRRFDYDVPTGMRALEAVEHGIRRDLGMQPLVPLGMGVLDAAPEFLFLVPGGGARQDFTPLGELARTDARGFAFYIEVMLGGWSPPTHDLDVFYFGDTTELAAALAHLVIKGVKRGTTGWLAAANHEGVAIPHVGMVSIVTDRFGHALCAIRTESLEQLRFADIGERHAWVEGEGDRTLADWRAGHLSYFHREATRLGLTFSEDEIVFFEHFRLLAVFGRPDQ